MNNKNNHSNRNNQQYQENDSLFSIWQNNNFYQRSDLGISQAYFDNNSFFGNSALSLKSLQIAHTPQDNLDNLHNNRQPDTISLTDMLKTNCSQQDINSINRMDGFNKFNNLNLSVGKEQEQQSNLDYDVLENVSNRKLQNRLNAKRAREKKKIQIDQMKDIINDLRAQNLMLKQDLNLRGKNDKYGYSVKNQNFKYCKRCRKQLFYIENYQNGQTLKQDKTSRKGQQNKFGVSKYIRIFNRTSQVEEEFRKNYSGHIYETIDQQISPNKDKILKQYDQLEFDEIQFRSFKPTHNHNHFQLQTKKIQQKKNRNRNWTGKLWLALGILMMVIGMQIHGLKGSGEKCIRISQKQTKRWISDLKDQSVTDFTIKMKTKIPGTFIQNQKEQKLLGFQKQRDKNKWNKKWTKDTQQRKFKGLGYQISSREQSSINQISNWQDYLSFEPEEIYSRNLAEQQQNQILIDKDLLYSIHAEFDDIGRYI